LNSALIVYSLCAAAAAFCTFLLARAWLRNKVKLLLWSSICFAGLTLNNLALWVDKLLLPTIDLSILRTSIALVSMMILLYGLVWNAE
jgi:hypothetical protein